MMGEADKGLAVLEDNDPAGDSVVAGILGPCMGAIATEGVSGEGHGEG